jgi:hypothetical protein
MTTEFGGELRWGVKRSFREYIEAAEGATRVEGGAAAEPDGRIVFPQVGADWDGPVPQVLRFGGSVEFEAHGGLLALRLRDPWLEFDETGAVLTVAHPAFRGPTDRRLPLCRLGGVHPRVEDGVLVIEDAPATLTIQATGTFDNLYPPGAEFDSVSARSRRK